MRDNILTKAKSKLMLENPYFGTLVNSLAFKENNNIASVTYQNDKFIYNSEYIEALNIEERVSLLANFAMKQALFHSNRGKGKRASIWNLASEYAINDLLIENGFTLPPLANYNSRFKGLYAEEIYTILASEIDFDKDDIEEKKKSKQKENLIDDKDYELLIKNLTYKLQKQNNLPKGIDRFLNIKIKPQISWRDRLYRYINTHAKNDYQMFPPNKKHLYRGIALPSIFSQELKIVVAIDTSASIDRDLLECFLGEIYEIMQIFPHYIIELIECDSKIQNITRLTPLEELHTTLKGGGGTDFRPVFDYVERLNEDFRFLIYFTDGLGEFPKYQPTIDTLWIIPSSKIAIPFGDILEITKP
jgi:predicted metal-dependent peptidase